MNFAVCDDEPNIVNHLSQIVTEYFNVPKLPVPKIFRFFSGEDLLSAELRYDLVFIDMQMKGINGVETIEELKRRQPNLLIIVVTDYPEYIDSAMNFSIFRYITKPIDETRIIKSLDKAMELLTKRSFKIKITDAVGSHLVPASSIIMIEYKNLLYIYTKEETFCVSDTFSYWKEHLSSFPFFYLSHRNYIINLNYVADYTFDEIILKAGKNVLKAKLTKRKNTEFERLIAKHLSRSY